MKKSIRERHPFRILFFSTIDQRRTISEIADFWGYHNEEGNTILRRFTSQHDFEKGEAAPYLDEDEKKALKPDRGRGRPPKQYGANIEWCGEEFDNELQYTPNLLGIREIRSFYSPRKLATIFGHGAEGRENLQRHGFDVFKILLEFALASDNIFRSLLSTNEELNEIIQEKAEQVDKDFERVADYLFYRDKTGEVLRYIKRYEERIQNVVDEVSSEIPYKDIFPEALSEDDSIEDQVPDTTTTSNYESVGGFLFTYTLACLRNIEQLQVIYEEYPSRSYTTQRGQVLQDRVTEVLTSDFTRE